MISMIVAMDQRRGIGKNNTLLAPIKPDLLYFKKITEGHVVIMGYNTYMSLPIRPLPHRLNVVMTRKDIQLENAMVIHSLEEALAYAQTQNQEVFICGGASIYEQFMPYAERLYITHIFQDLNAQVFFPPIDEQWKIKHVQANRENIEHKYPHVFTIYEK